MGKLDEAADAYREAIRLKPDLAVAHNNLGSVLKAQGKLDESIAAYREAIRIKPDLAFAYNNLGASLQDQGKQNEAVAAYREAVRIKLDFAVAHLNLGVALRALGKAEEAADACREAIRLKPDYADAHVNLGIALGDLGKAEEAADACREAIRLKPDLASAHYNLGIALHVQGKLEEAADACREAIRLKPDFAEAHVNLGVVLRDLGKAEEAADAYREAIRVKPDLASAHRHLGLLLQSCGLYRDALISLRKAHELGSKEPGLSYPSAALVRACESLIELEDRLPDLLKGETQPKDTADRLALGQVGFDTKRFAASARFWGEALADDPKLGDDRMAQHRYNAACSAAMAGVGQGIDDPKPDDAARAKLRDQAKGSLRAELSAWEKVAMTAEPGNKELVVKTLQHWKTDADLAGVRDADALAKLPEPERAEWLTLWADVDALLAKVAKP